MKVDVTIQVAAARKRLKNYQKRQLPASVTRALNRTLRGTVTDTKKIMAKKINLTQGKIGTYIKRHPASGKAGYNRYEAKMSVSEKRKPNIASFKGTKALKSGMVVGKPWKTRVKYGKTSFLWSRQKAGPYAAGKGISGTAFHRVKGEKALATKGRYAGTKAKREKIKPLFGDSVSGLFTQRPKQGRSVKSTLRPMIRNRFVVELDRQLARIKE